MNPETAKLLEELAAKLGTTSAYLWGVLVRQAYLDGWLNISYDVIAIICVTLIGRRVHKLLADPGFDPEDSLSNFSRTALLCVGGGGLVLICTIHLLTDGLDFVTAWGNPEYWALKEIGEILRK